MAAPVGFLPSLSPTITSPPMSFSTSSVTSVGKRRQYVREAQTELAQRGQEMGQKGYMTALTKLVKEKASRDATFLKEDIPIINETNCRNDLGVFKQQRQVEPFVRQAVNDHNGHECAANDHWKCVVDRVKELIDASTLSDSIRRMLGRSLCQETAAVFNIRLGSTQAAPAPSDSIVELNNLIG